MAKSYFSCIQTKEGASLYFDFWNNIIDIDIPDSVKTITFSGEKAVSGKNYHNVKLRNVNKQFSQVKEIIIEKDIVEMEITNEMFPNVRKVTSFSSSFASGTMLVATSDKNKLKNTFCLKENEVIDLDGIKVICEYAFSGCASTNIKNWSKPELLSDALKGSMFVFQPYIDNIILLHDVIVGINSSADDIFIENNVRDIYISVDCGYINKLHVRGKNGVKMLFNLMSTRREASINIREIYIDSDEKDTVELLIKNYNYLKFEKIHIKDTNPWYKTIDGIIYSKDGTALVACPTLKSGEIHIPEGVKYICERAFCFAHCIQSVTMPDTLVYIGWYAFYACTSLTKVNLGKGIQQISESNIFDACHIVDLDIPEQVKYIGDMTFQHAGIKNLHLHEGLLNIGSSAFAYNKIKEVEIPNSVQTLGKRCFFGVSDIYLAEESHPIGLISAITKDTQSYIDKDFSQLVSISQNGDKIYLPKYISNDNEKKLDMEYMLYGLMNTDKAKTLYEFALDNELKQDIALKIYKLTGYPEIASYLRRTGGNYASRLLKNGGQEELIEFLKLGFMTQNALKKIKQKSDSAGAVLVSAYILDVLDNGKKDKGSFNL